MPKEFPRSLRIGEQIRRELSELLRDDIKDPRVNRFSISEVIVSKDLSNAKVFYSPQFDHPDREDLQAGLESTAPYLRKRLGKILSTRIIPTLTFHYDDSLDRYSRIESLINKELRRIDK